MFPFRKFKIVSIGLLLISLGAFFQPAQASSEAALQAGLFDPYVTLPQINNNRNRYAVIGDFNNDGLNDVASLTNFPDAILYIYIQQAGGTLATPVEYACPGSPRGMDSGDVNNDGRDDIVISADSGIYVFIQNAAGTFDPPSTYLAGDQADSIRIGDINNDALNEVVFMHWDGGNGYLGVLYQQLDGSLGNLVLYGTPSYNYEIELGDINHDGLLDVVGLEHNNLEVLLQNPGGTLDPVITYPLNIPPTIISAHGLAIGEVTGDALADVVVSYGGNSPNAFIGVLSQNAAGTLEPMVSTQAYDIPEPVELADLNLDGRLDVVIAHGGWNRVGVFPQDPGGGFSNYYLYPVPYASHYRMQGMDVGDINGDCAPDVVLADYNHGTILLYNTTPVAACLPEIEVQGNSVVIADGDTTPSTADYTDFGLADIGVTLTRRFNILNTGYDLLSLTGNPIVSITGPHAADFSVFATPSTPVDPLSSTPMVLQCTPGDVGVRTAEISIANNDTDENPYNFTVQCTGAAPEIDVQGNGVSIADGDNTPSTADQTDFGAVPVGSTQDYTFTIENPGTADLDLAAAPPLVTLTGAAFTLVTDATGPVIAGGSTTFTVRFTPPAVGLHTGAISIDNNDADETPYNFTIQGTGTNNLAATAACNGDDLEVTITDGDDPFDITGTGADLPQNNVPAGTYTLTGPDSWTGVTITETAGDTESITLGDFTCPTTFPPQPMVAGSGLAAAGGPACTITIDVEASVEVVSIGDPVLWTVQITNPGPAVCDGILGYGTMPSEFTILDIQPERGILSWDGGQYFEVDLGSVEAGDSVLIEIDSRLEGTAAFTLPDGAAALNAGQQICFTGHLTETNLDTDCVTLFPDSLPSTGADPVENRLWWWVAIGLAIMAIGGNRLLLKKQSGRQSD